MIKNGTLVEVIINDVHIHGIIIYSISAHKEYKIRLIHYRDLIHREWWIHECDILEECK
jgi:hypothetical protein